MSTTMKLSRLALAATLILLSACKSSQPDYTRALPEGAPALLPLGPDEKRPDFSGDFARRDDILPALDQSIAWTKRKTSAKHFPIEGVSAERALASLERFRELLTTSKSAQEFDQRLGEEFTVYKSAGGTGRAAACCSRRIARRSSRARRLRPRSTAIRSTRCRPIS
jgi:hypothetical protein